MITLGPCTSSKRSRRGGWGPVLGEPPIQCKRHFTDRENLAGRGRSWGAGPNGSGVLSDSPEATVHAVHMTLHGPETLCGAGPIVGRVLKRFGEADRYTCLACFAAALPEARSAP